MKTNAVLANSNRTDLADPVDEAHETVYRFEQECLDLPVEVEVHSESGLLVSKDDLSYRIHVTDNGAIVVKRSAMGSPTRTQTVHDLPSLREAVRDLLAA